jgi:hypothetical protein
MDARKSDSTIHSHDTHTLTRTVTTRLSVCVHHVHMLPCMDRRRHKPEQGKTEFREIFSPGREWMVILK